MKDIVLASAICLAGCSTLVPATLMQLNGVDPLFADPAAIALRIDLPAGLSLPPDAGTLDLAATLRDGTTRAGQFPIERVGDILQVTPGAHDDLRALQAEIRTWKDADPDGTSGSLSVDLAPCLTAPALPDNARISVAIRLDADGPFLPLVRDASVQDAMKGQALTDVTPCS
ncbi:hypothetical protein [uncultured Tateyamaria sp.]|uniref:hypothetical protein n=1 Tax=uncultured Tateyamaria sp. TaxID=455651 RepID=UPI00260F203B|nr:hypothetical protein [uncultured Tateyamaria sp.]